MGDIMTGEKHVKEVNEETDVEFKWGNKLEVDEQNPTSQLYESFVYDGIEYSLFDCVYFGPEPVFSVGKLVKIWELPNHERMVEVVWFFRPEEIRDLFGDDESLQNELLLASGEGRGLSNVNVLEAISGKCNVVCASKDRRNPQPSKVELSMADFTFYRTFDVGSCRAVDNFPDTIAGIKAQHCVCLAYRDTYVPQWSTFSTEVIKGSFILVRSHQI
ncbi:protein ANTI-SILENCING 1-like isoform X2 [Durio zibethinus]|uniref:Protein ANTI-SILENCING 1-like isoform X2 n=1 Tax=Durio zibethinus TaxID=66656 RepID=A0A6P6BJA9_DURZI|nr:protein ANTI-SILENCING 1-like isoform X2 [Durio zibethinus]